MIEQDWWFYYDPSPEYAHVKGGLNVLTDQEKADQLEWLAAHADTVEARKQAKQTARRLYYQKKNMNFVPVLEEVEPVDFILDYVRRQAEAGGPIFIS